MGYDDDIKGVYYKNSQFSKSEFHFFESNMEDSIFTYNELRRKVHVVCLQDHQLVSKFFMKENFKRILYSTFPHLYEKYKLLLTD